MTTFTFTVNWWVIAALVGIIVGFIVAGVGMVAGADPEGRGGSLWIAIPIGLLLMIVSVVYCLYRLGAVFHFWS